MYHSFLNVLVKKKAKKLFSFLNRIKND
jgi:hypothetical protein